MKKIWTIALIMICMKGYAQNGSLPPEVESAFKAKYNDARMGDWWVENQLYYIDYTFRGGSFIVVYDGQGTWKETAETISELDIPEALKKYIRTNFPAGRICYCEKVETSELKRFLRINLMDAGNVNRVIRSDQEGKNIVILDNHSL